MRIEKGVSGAVTILEFHGRFDAHQAPVVRSAFLDLLDDGESRLVVNMTGVTFIDSAGLAALVQGMKRTREQGGDLHLCALQDAVRIIIELAGLDMAFAIFESTAAAVEAFAATTHV